MYLNHYLVHARTSQKSFFPNYTGSSLKMHEIHTTESAHKKVQKYNLLFLLRMFCKNVKCVDQLTKQNLDINIIQTNLENIRYW